MLQLKRPFITTSANLAGEEAVKSRRALSRLSSLDSILTVGEEYPDCGGGAPSTVVKIDLNNVEILRSGELSEDILNLFYRLKK